MKRKRKGKGKGKEEREENVVAIDERGGFIQTEEANPSEIGAMEVHHMGETPHCVGRGKKAIVKATIGKLSGESIYCIEDASDTQNQKFKSNKLDHVAVTGYLENEDLMVVEEITCDVKGWYSSIFSDFKTESADDWWKHLEYDLKKLLREIVKLFAKLSPDISHGTVMGDMVIYHGKLYRMRYDGYQRDIKSLHYIVQNVLARVQPEELGSSEECHGLMSLYKDSKLKGFNEFLSNLKDGYEQKKQVHWCRPFFWFHKERLHFLDNLYTIFVREKFLIPNHVLQLFDKDFVVGWFWTDRVPSGPFEELFNYVPPGARPRRQYWTMSDSIAFCHNSINHYNSHVKKSQKNKTVEEIETELNEIFEVCSHVFTAVCNFIDRIAAVHSHKVLRERLIALREEMSFFPINAIASTASTSTPNSNTI